ncbi:MAG: DUF3192 domain-containing protein [bacterium]|nr:MAG: DUF3192 domain-containing protein [bacterium]
MAGSALRASIWLVLAASVLLACSVETPPREGVGETGPGGIVVGMTREQVVQAMLQEVQALQMAGRVRNPYATLFIPGRDGETLEVMYYYVTMKKGDNVVTSDEMVPVILKGGRVAGWGWELLEELAGGRPAPEEPG